jgi:GNAT superfamily N-acetyltransferase
MAINTMSSFLTGCDILELSTLSPRDYYAIIEVWNAAGLPFKPLGRDSQAEVVRQMALDPEMWLGCFIEGKLVGVVIGSYDSRKGWLNRLAVVPEHQGKGCATMRHWLSLQKRVTKYMRKYRISENGTAQRFKLVSLLR